MNILALLLLALTRKNFLRYANLYSLVFGLSMEFLLVLATTFLLIMGEVDLSIGSVYAFAGVFTGYLVYIPELPIWVAIPITLCITALVGLVNGTLVVRLKANSLMITIGTMILFRGVADGLINLLGGITYPAEYRAIVGFKILNVHFTIFLMFAAVIVLEWLLLNHVAFKKMFYIGSNTLSARLYGVSAGRVKLSAYVASGLLAGVAGVLAASRSGQTTWNTGTGPGVQDDHGGDPGRGQPVRRQGIDRQIGPGVVPDRRHPQRAGDVQHQPRVDQRRRRHRPDHRDLHGHKDQP